MTIKNDQIYINQILKGDANAFAFLVEKYKIMVFTLALKMLKSREEAEEISQDTFIKAYKNIDKFKGDAKFSTWLYKIAYRTCLDSIKKNSKKYQTGTIDEITINKIKSTEGVLDSIERKERAEIINKCLIELPEDERSVIWLFYFEELSLKEIIDITDLSEANVKVKLHRARKRLLTIVEKRVEPELINHYGRK
ncbi:MULTISPECIES: RNA polymerase sigma factor [Tenacibaculum]|uniref:RNA polymerase sigma factor n=1 Tax=Tenacibaculum TaxID=104267 RepID=UPI0008988FDC|nr:MULTISPECIES: sigma-70 family RNA polymerase sigma factor [unclassified Tenacibaculum]RBW55803.1 RNA polymerase [Tenacibaculum sp. E3R01]SEE63220.1 RNA polymerase, sigma subunit, ECF family [Tenacibaculum sp. MAR_2010_89]